MARWWRRADNPALVALLIAAIVASALAGLRTLGALQALEFRAYDLYLSLRRKDASAPDWITLVTVGEDDLERYGFPLPDGVMSQALSTLLALEPRAIGLDIYRDRPVPPGSDSFRDLAAEEWRLVTVMAFPGGRPLHIEAPEAVRDDPSRFGFADIPLDEDGVVRRGLLFADDGRTVFTSLALQLALRYLQPSGLALEPAPDDPTLLKFGDAVYRPLQGEDAFYSGGDTAGYQYLLTYPAGFDTPTRIPFGDVLEGRFTPDLVRDHVIIVGTTAESVKDSFASPLRLPGTGASLIYGADLHAQAVAQLVAQALGDLRPLSFLPGSFETLWALIAALLGAFAALFMRKLRWLLAIVALGIVVILASAYAALLRDLWLPVVTPLLAWLAAPAFMAAYLSHRELRQRQAVMGLFSTYVSERVADSLWQQRDDLMEGGRPRPQVLPATVLFSDIRGFTPITERLAVDQMMIWLDQYMRAMTDIIVAHDGVIEKFMGDGIVAVFGVPIPRKDQKEIAADARAAVDVALEMRAALDKLNPQWEQADLPPVGIRVGITTGSLVAGSVGSSRRLQYTILGDVVNTAARLESYAGPSELQSEQDHCRILVSEATYECLGPGYRGEFFGALTLKGKAQTVNVYCIHGWADEREKGKADNVV